MFDELALRRAKAMLVRHRAGLPLQDAYKHYLYIHGALLVWLQSATVRHMCGHVSRRKPRLQSEHARQCQEACPPEQSVCSLEI